MHYYKFNIADYRKDTGHLTTVEHGIYRQLIDWYYLDEQPIPTETHVTARRLRLGKDEIKPLENVLADFFVLSEAGYKHKRIDAEINDYHAQAEKNQRNGKLGGRPKKTQSVISGNPEQSQNNPNHKLINSETHKLINSETIDTDIDAPLNDVHPCTTFTQTVSTESATEQKQAKPKKQKAPYELIMKMYNEILHELPQATELTESRKKLIDDFWLWILTTNRASGKRKATNEQEAIKYSEDFFYSITEDDFIMGRTIKTGKHQNWRASIDYILSPKGRTKCVEMANYRANKEQ